MATADGHLIDYKTRIKEMSETIINSLHLADILDDMVSYCALTVDDRAFIDAQPTLARKNRMFLEVILSRGDIACEVFVDLLRENSHYSNLLEQIDRHAMAYDEFDSSPMNLPEESNFENLVPEYKVRLQKNYKKIASVKFHCMFDFLLAKDVLSFTDYDDIRSEATLTEQNRKLVDILMLKDEMAYQQFVDTLRLGDKCLSIAEDIETTVVTREERKRLAEQFSDKTEQQMVKLSKQVETLSSENQRLRSEVETMRDPILSSMREHFKECITDWELEEERYCVTRATNHVQQLVESVNCIVVTGSSGNGKSALIHHVALQMHKQRKYEIIPFVVDLSDIIRYSDPRKHQVFVIDDICGKVTVNVQTVDWWYTHLGQIEKILAKGTIKLLASCRLQIYNDPQFRRLKQLFNNECNLLSTDFSVLQKERILIADKYFPKSTVNYIKDLIETYDFFPLLCKLYHRRPTVDARMFFTKPIDGIREDLKVIQQFNKLQYCAIVMVIIFNNRFKFEWLKPRSSSQEVSLVISDICRECIVDLRTQSNRKEFKEHLDSLLKTYIKKSDNSYRMIHDKIYDIGAVVCGQHLSECFITHADSTFIGDRFRFESIKEDTFDDLEDYSSDEDTIEDQNGKAVTSDENVIFISSDEEETYFDRLIEDLKRGITYSAFHNQQLHYNIYRSKFIAYFKTRQSDVEKLLRQIEEQGQELSARNYKENDYRSIRLPLIESVFEGHVNIVEMLLDFQCDINLCDKFGRSALHVAAMLGYSPVAKLLIERGADTSLSTCMGHSALFAACEGGHYEIVKTLLTQNVNSSKCDMSSRTPLYIVCQEGHLRILKLLLTRKDDGFLCDNAGRSPFFVACKAGHSEIVKTLLESSFDVYKCSTNGFSPLHIACQQGHTSVVKQLLSKNFDIHQCEHNLRAPLHLACEGGHTNVVKLLLQQKASISKCDRSGRSPLYTACEGGHASVVRMLLDNNADITQCDPIGRSPLYTACAWGHAEVVDILLKRKRNADVLHDVKGYSALHIACYTGHIAPVMLLLKHDFRISQEDKSGQTPLLLACKAGHTDIVKFLLDKNADANKRDNNGRSALYVASREGHLEIVHILLEYKADPDIPDNDGMLPWQMAWKGRHTEIVKTLTENNPAISIDSRHFN
ncbi:uncharacterized protein LOC134707914 [Mytilus trossulus]|uniref:uncharacterized protein LOC134707914 n=1 Tax=Mytilus trossulus TaxID=6551 RepID=UPI00300467D3